MNNWEVQPLANIVALQRGHDLPEKQRRPGAVPVIGSFGQTGWHDAAKTSSEGVCIGRSGSSFGTVTYCEQPFWPLNTVLYVTDFKGNHPRFIYYLLKTVDFEAFNSGSAQPSLNRNYIGTLKLRVPEIAIQHRISGVLERLDRKIELNRQTARTLEELAQRLFKSWFVDFDPVRAKMAGRQPAHTPPEIADLFSDRLVDSPLGPIPEGWEAKQLQEMVSLDTTSIKPASEPDAEWQHYSIPAYDSGQMPLNELGANIKSGKYRVKPGSVLVSKLNPGDWRAWLPDSGSITARSICSTEFMQFVVDELKHRAFIWGLANSAYFQAGVMETVSGTTGSRQRAQPKQVKQLLIITPDEKLLSAYADIVLPMFDRKAGLLREVETLSQLRDRLLPKLISGEIRVPEAQEMAEESAS
jgi:type I restriction enzyme S subunit